jgi:hypothetical protein
MTWRRTENQRHGIGLHPAEATGDRSPAAHGTKRIERPELALSRGAGRQVAVARVSTISAKHEV